MSNSMSLLPTSLALSSDSAIEAILADIPLFCEGIMGIGVFTFLFLTKQVKLISVFLYAATFMAFVAATVDLGQVISRGPQTTADGIGLQSVTALIFTREITLAISIFFLDLTFWMLVARCPRGECNDKPSELSTQRNRTAKAHSASWNRWGLMGTLLKWSTLAALISVPLLQMVWRLIPNQRKYSTVYVAESTIQTSVTAIFILKFILNILISPMTSWWRALQHYSVPMASLFIGAGLGVGNLTVFAFSETTLGRFLRAVEVYLLIVHSLYISFQESTEKLQQRTEEQPQLSEKGAASEFAGGLPFAYAPTRTSKIGPDPFFSRPTFENRRTSTISWVVPSPANRISPAPARESTGADSVVLARYSPPPVTQMKSPVKSSPKVSPFQPAVKDRQSKVYEPQEVELDLASIARPVTSVSLSYYTMERTYSGITKDMALPATSQGAIDLSDSPKGSITSLDELFRQQTELDKSIAALRLTSTLLSNRTFDAPDSDVLAESQDKSRTTLTSNKTESISNRSDFSLSVFPDPPLNEQKDEVASKYSIEPSRSQDFGKGKKRAVDSDVAQDQFLGVGKPLQMQSSQDAQFDVTSFIGDLSDSSRNSLDSLRDVQEDAEEISDIPATAAQTNGLRPMILPLKISATQRDESSSTPTSPPRGYDNERSSLSPATSLKPLLLARPPSSRVMPLQSVTMVPLAQRRQRGGTISSNTRRPVIGLPRMYEEPEDGDFERPRAAPAPVQPRTL